MPILKPADKHEKEQVRLNLDTVVWSQVKAYCEWAHFNSKEDFIEQAVEFVLKKDKEWARHLKQVSTESE